MIHGPGSRAAEITRAAAPLVLAGLIAATLLCLPPTQYSFYPQCPVYRYLHLLCPGCGTTRALAALLRGHVGEAIRYNALTTLMLPMAVGYAAYSYRRYLRRERLHPPQPPAFAIYGALVVAAAFTVARNLAR